ncbi:MAG: peroxide stress protein YaaA [Hyphomicrobiales bacterium]
MLMIISPAKSIDMAKGPQLDLSSQPVFSDKANTIANKLKDYSVADLCKLMSISTKLGQLNYGRYQEWSDAPQSKDLRQAILAFRGDVYTGMNADSFSVDDFKFAQDHLLILSGLYGALKPLDLIQEYRLEMGSKLSVNDNKDLYAFWSDKLTTYVNELLKKNKTLINLASNEYSKSVKMTNLSPDTSVVTPIFKDFKNGEYKIISFFAKKARGMMASYIIKNKISDVDQLKLFDLGGYYFDDTRSNDKEFVFLRN